MNNIIHVDIPKTWWAYMKFMLWTTAYNLEFQIGLTDLMWLQKEQNKEEEEKICSLGEPCKKKIGQHIQHNLKLSRRHCCCYITRIESELL